MGYRLEGKREFVSNSYKWEGRKGHPCEVEGKDAGAFCALGGSVLAEMSAGVFFRPFINT